MSPMYAHNWSTSSHSFISRSTMSSIESSMAPSTCRVSVGEFVTSWMETKDPSLFLKKDSILIKRLASRVFWKRIEWPNMPIIDSEDVVYTTDVTPNLVHSSGPSAHQ